MDHHHHLFHEEDGIVFLRINIDANYLTLTLYTARYRAHYR
jgi:hypothetical protein